ncbi:MAG TPA: hypothetical protein VGN99_10140 [Steroidobacteraceae bacterium]|jgi:hypothetical protein|nr:hypothetical protein [Steroidobacteraceae bacterium]
MVRLFVGLCIAVAVAAPAVPKPIAFADGTTVMAEYGAGTMQELQIFYAPRFDYSVGGGHVDFSSDVDDRREHINYARLNWLAHRWNLDDAQANIFVWGGAGSATGNQFTGTRIAGNAGVQVDYETRRVYASMKSDLQRSAEFSDRIDTLQLGVAPYKHDYGGVATWFVFQARHYPGELHSGIETAALLRLFKGGAWIEAGVTNAGKVQAMAMFNF